MKVSILSLLLGLSFTIAAPVAMADSKWVAKQSKHAKQGKHFSGNSYNNNTCNDRRHNHQETRHQYNNHRNTNHQNNNSGWAILSGVDNIRWNQNNHRNHNNNYGPRISERQDKQARKIRRGIRKGQLVHWEVKQLREEQRRISKRLSHYRSDGRLNRHERNKIHRMLDVAGNNIRNKRHNRITTNYRDDRNNYSNHNNNFGYQQPRNSSYEFVINW